LAQVLAKGIFLGFTPTATCVLGPGLRSALLVAYVLVAGLLPARRVAAAPVFVFVFHNTLVLWFSYMGNPEKTVPQSRRASLPKGASVVLNDEVYRPQIKSSAKEY
jgi:hypothetical protein